jgi:hypothetical protein
VSRNAFQPGVYYFNFAGATPAVKKWVINSEVIVGAPADGQQYEGGVSTPCSTVGMTPGNTVFVFGGDSRVEIGNGGLLEIFTDATNPRLPNAAIVGHWIGAPAWIAPPTVFPHTIIGFDALGGVQKLAVHGVTSHLVQWSVFRVESMHSRSF